MTDYRPAILNEKKICSVCCGSGKMISYNVRGYIDGELRPCAACKGDGMYWTNPPKKEKTRKPLTP